jgi:hypothetical protein
MSAQKEAGFPIRNPFSKGTASVGQTQPVTQTPATNKDFLSEIGSMTAPVASEIAEQAHPASPILGAVPQKGGITHPHNVGGPSVTGPGQQAVTIHGIPAITPNLQTPNTTPMSLPKTAAPDREKVIQEILVDSADLLQKTAELEQKLAGIPVLEQKVASLEAEVTSSRQKMAEFEAMKAKVVQRVEKFAAALVTHGSLGEDKKAEFIAKVAADPSQVVDVMEKLAAQVQVSQFGSGDDSAATNKGAKGPDPIEKFASGS